MIGRISGVWKRISEIYGNRLVISKTNEFNLNEYWKLRRTLLESQIGGKPIGVSLIKDFVFIVLYETLLLNRRFNSPDWRFNLKTINIDICLMTRPPKTDKLIKLKKSIVESRYINVESECLNLISRLQICLFITH